MAVTKSVAVNFFLFFPWILLDGLCGTGGVAGREEGPYAWPSDAVTARTSQAALYDLPSRQNSYTPSIFFDHPYGSAAARTQSSAFSNDVRHAALEQQAFPYSQVAQPGDRYRSSFSQHYSSLLEPRRAQSAQSPYRSSFQRDELDYALLPPAIASVTPRQVPVSSLQRRTQVAGTETPAWIAHDYRGPSLTYPPYHHPLTAQSSIAGVSSAGDQASSTLLSRTLDHLSPGRKGLVRLPTGRSVWPLRKLDQRLESVLPTTAALRDRVHRLVTSPSAETGATPGDVLFSPALPRDLRKPPLTSVPSTILQRHRIAYYNAYGNQVTPGPRSLSQEVSRVGQGISDVAQPLLSVLSHSQRSSSNPKRALAAEVVKMIGAFGDGVRQGTQTYGAVDTYNGYANEDTQSYGDDSYFTSARSSSPRTLGGSTPPTYTLGPIVRQTHYRQAHLPSPTRAPVTSTDQTPGTRGLGKEVYNAYSLHETPSQNLAGLSSSGGGVAFPQDGRSPGTPSPDAPLPPVVPADAYAHYTSRQKSVYREGARRAPSQMPLQRSIQKPIPHGTPRLSRFIPAPSSAYAWRPSSSAAFTG